MFRIWSRFRQTIFGDDVFPILKNYGTYRRTNLILKKSQFWNENQIKEFQSKQLTNLIHHVYKNVPYYRKIFDNQKLKPPDIKEVVDLRKIPFLTKKIIKDNINLFKAKNYPKNKFHYVSTGGNTGNTLRFYIEKDIWYAIDIAFSINAINRITSSNKGKYVFLRHHLIRSLDGEKFWKYSLFGRWLILSSYHLSEKNLPKYVELIRKFKPKFFIGYPSSISLLVRYMVNKNLEPFEYIKTVICGGENLYDWQRNLIEKKFKCNILDIYGHAERTIFSATCGKSNYHHIYPEYGILELIGKNGKPVTKEGGIGELVGTGFHNKIFPFIRYRTGDLGILTLKKCPCGSNYPLLKEIKGRKQELIVSKSGSLLPITGIFGLVGRRSNNVIESQFYQEKEGEIILKIIKGKEYSNLDERRIKRAFYNRYSNEVDLIIDYVSEIPRSSRGRHLFIIQKLPVDF